MLSITPRLRPLMRLSVVFFLFLGDGFLPNRALAEEQQETAASADSDADSPAENEPSPKEEQQGDNDPQSSETDTVSGKSDSIAQPVQKPPAQPESVVSSVIAKPPGVESKITKVNKVDKLSRGKTPTAKEDVPSQIPAKGNDQPQSKRLIGAVAFVMENQSQLIFRARVDTGAQSCSIHTEEVRIEDPAETMEANVGKVVRIKLKNDREESEWVETSISRIVRVKTSEQAEERYCVSLVLVYEGLEKEVRVTLNDRSHMVYPLLLGRNFLQGDFLVDVDVPAPK